MTIEQYEGDGVLGIMEKYAPNRNASVEKLIVAHLRLDKPNQHFRILEFGAGKGEFIKRFIKFKNIEVQAVETDLSYIEKLSKTVKVFRAIEDVPDGLDCIYLIDVLEHLEDDRYFLNCFFEKLKKNGRMFIYVPARMELYSAFDKKIGHYRRYTKKELKDKVTEAGFTVEVIRYHEVLGYFASMFNKMAGGSPDLNVNAVKFYDNVLVPSTNFIEKYIRFKRFDDVIVHTTVYTFSNVE